MACVRRPLSRFAPAPPANTHTYRRPNHIAMTSFSRATISTPTALSVVVAVITIVTTTTQVLIITVNHESQQSPGLLIRIVLVCPVGKGRNAMYRAVHVGLFRRLASVVFTVDRLVELSSFVWMCVPRSLVRLRNNIKVRVCGGEKRDRLRLASLPIDETNDKRPLNTLSLGWKKIKLSSRTGRSRQSFRET
jgi:hypothetical protein